MSCQLGLIDNDRDGRIAHYTATEYAQKIYKESDSKTIKSIFIDCILNIVKKGKEEESLCMKCFVTHMEKKLGLQNIQYGGDQDPPDFWCKIKAKKYAVEVTRIVNKLDKIPGRPGSIDSAMYRDWLQKLAKKIDTIEECIDNKYLKTKFLFIKYSKDFDIATLMELRDLVEFMEQATDICADTADYVRVLATGEEKI